MNLICIKSINKIKGELPLVRSTLLNSHLSRMSRMMLIANSLPSRGCQILCFSYSLPRHEVDRGKPLFKTSLQWDSFKGHLKFSCAQILTLKFYFLCIMYKNFICISSLIRNFQYWGWCELNFSIFYKAYLCIHSKSLIVLMILIQSRLNYLYFSSL